MCGKRTFNNFAANVKCSMVICSVFPYHASTDRKVELPAQKWDTLTVFSSAFTDGTLSFDARQLIYDVMLQRLSMVQKLNLQCRLARQIFEHAADVTDEGDGELPTSLSAALMDTITLLCGPRMKLPSK